MLQLQVMDLDALSINRAKIDKKFDLILTDYNMPNMDGLELTLKIREEYDKDELGIIILSSNNEPEIASQFLKIGANDFINKPYNEIEVLTRINSNSRFNRTYLQKQKIWQIKTF